MLLLPYFRCRRGFPMVLRVKGSGKLSDTSDRCVLTALCLDRPAPRDSGTSLCIAGTARSPTGREADRRAAIELNRQHPCCVSYSGINRLRHARIFSLRIAPDRLPPAPELSRDAGHDVFARLHQRQLPSNTPRRSSGRQLRLHSRAENNADPYRVSWNQCFRRVAWRGRIR